MIVAVALLLLLIVPNVGFAQNEVAFEGVPLGIKAPDFINQLKEKGFKLDIKQDTDNDMFYGVCKEYFMSGTIDGNPAVVNIKTSKKTQTVYKVSVVLREFIDAEEAADEADRLLPRILSCYPKTVKDPNWLRGIHFVRMPSGKKRVTSYLCSALAGMVVRLYNDHEQVDVKNSVGRITMYIYENMTEHKSLLEFSYYSAAACKVAEREAMPEKPIRRALTIFISDYPEESGWRKTAANNDKSLIMDMLHNNGFAPENIISVENSDATCAGILSALDKLCEECTEGDEVYIHFSCHGQRITDQDGDEALNDPSDRYDEAIVPYDAYVSYGWNGYRGDKHLIDDVLNQRLWEIKRKVGTYGVILLVVDACHSGDIQREVDENSMIAYRGSYDDFNAPLMNVPQAEYANLTDWITISACKSFQTNFEVNIDGKMYGRLSYAMSKCFSAGLTAKDLVDNVVSIYKILPLPKGKYQSISYDITPTVGDRKLFK